MAYTLAKFFLWFAGAALIGVAVGWMLRSLRSRTELAAARSSTPPPVTSSTSTASVDGADVDRMRQRLADLEHVVEERDRLRIKVAELRAGDSPGIVTSEVPVTHLDPATVIAGSGGTDVETGRGDADVATSPGRGASAGDEDVSTTGGLAVDEVGTRSEEDDESAAVVGIPVEAENGRAGSVDPMSSLDVEAARSVLGKRIEIDDLTVVEGIGPKISDLCRGIGIETWRALADTDVATLRSMLDDAGPRYQIHHPGSWPEQAGLLAAGRWNDFKRFTDDLAGGS